jgi:hypothetical protein
LSPLHSGKLNQAERGHSSVHIQILYQTYELAYLKQSPMMMMLHASQNGSICKSPWEIFIQQIVKMNIYNNSNWSILLK